MSLNSFEFWVFFLLLLVLRQFVRTANGDKWLLLAASVAFYFTSSLPAVFLLAGMSALGWYLGRRMQSTSEPGPRQRLLAVYLLSNLGILAFFKYTNFFLENFSGALNVVGFHASIWHYYIPLPPAISYFTFASLSYGIDVYYERMPAATSLRDYTLFISFFPKLMSGPIERAITFLPQLEGRRQSTIENIETGLTQFLLGLVKKSVLADQIAANVNLIFANAGQYDRLTLWQGMVGYAIQLYCDFSGYSDMAIGCARMLGFNLRENFQMPFSALSITEFWRRWHISLTEWFRDYIFLPLEMATRGNPNALLRVSLNIIVTMVLVGLWHGASWGFVLFGLMNGLALCAHKLWTVWDPLKDLRGRGLYAVVGAMAARALTLGVFFFSSVLFRAPTAAQGLSYWRGMCALHAHGTRMMSPYIFPAAGVVLVAHLCIQKDRNWAQEVAGMPLTARMAICTAFAMILAFLGTTENVPFVYFQF